MGVLYRTQKGRYRTHLHHFCDMSLTFISSDTSYIESPSAVLRQFPSRPQKTICELTTITLFVGERTLEDSWSDRSCADCYYSVHASALCLPYSSSSCHWIVEEEKASPIKRLHNPLFRDGYHICILAVSDACCTRCVSTGTKPLQIQNHYFKITSTSFKYRLVLINSNFLHASK